MNKLPPVFAPERSRRRTVLRVVLGIIALLVLVPLTGFGIWRLSLSARLARQLQSIRAAGLPTTPAELDAFYPAVPDAENAALLFDEASQMLPSQLAKEDQKLREQLTQLRRGDPLPKELAEFLAQQMSDHQAALEMARRGAALTNSRYPVDLNRGFQAALPHLAKVKGLVQLLREQAIYEAAAGHPDRAADAVATGFAAGRSLANEPILISYLVRNAMNALTASGLEQVVNRVALSDAQLSRLQSAAAAGEDTNGIARALAGERGCSIEIFRNPGAYAAMMDGVPGGGPPDILRATPKALNRLTGFFDRDLSFYLATMQKYIDATAQPPPARLDAVRVFDEKIAEARRRFYILTSLLAPALGRAMERDAENSARLRVAATGLAVQRYRLAHGGELPESLAALVPALLPVVPVDPFTGEEMKYLRQGKGFVVYSVGTNRTDDGGVSPEPKKRGAGGASGGDICFAVDR